MSVEEPILYALLVGINEYVNKRESPTLGGCVNDVDAMAQLLRDRFNVPPENIRKLTDNQATHGAIKQAFQEHLIARARAWAEAGKEGTPPAFLFHYSGHGSQALDETGSEPDGLDETIVPHDSRTEGVYDIKDWELGGWLGDLAHYSENVTVILDCCHSGSGTRDAKATLVRTRRCQPDLRPQPARRPPAVARTRALTSASGWETGDGHVLLAACRDREEANEYMAWEGQAVREHGALTYFLIQELSQMTRDRPITYRELHERVRYQVNSTYQDQMPQCEGGRDRLVFGGLRPAREVFLNVVDKRLGLIWVDGGLAHGLTVGSELHVYPPETRALAEAGPPLARLRVEEVGAVRSGCTLEEGGPDIPLPARATVYRLNYGDMQRPVVLDVPPGPDQAALQARLAAPDVEDYVRLVPPDAPADFRIQQAGEGYEIQDASGRLLVSPFPPDKLGELGPDLVHLVRYHNSLDLQNRAGHSELAGAVGLAVRQLAFDAATGDPRAVPFEPGAGGEVMVDAGERIVLEVTNHADLPLYFALFDFSYDWSVTQLYPRVGGAHEALAPGKTISIGLSRKRSEQLAPQLPQEVAEARQIVKVIATVDDADFELLQQGPLKAPFAKRGARTRDGKPVSALSRLLEQAMVGGTRSALGPPPASIEDEWTTAQIEFRLTQEVDGAAVTRDLRGGNVTILPAYRLELEPPPGFQGRARVLTPRQSTRAAGGDMADLRPPPGLASLVDLIQPLAVAPTRADGPAGAVIEIEADGAARALISPERPLKVCLPAGAAAGEGTSLALAYDGSFFYPVGRPGDEAGVLQVEWLPEPAPEGEAALRRLRGLGRTVKLYLYKILRWPEPGLGLRRAHFVPDLHIDEDRPEPGEHVRRVAGGGVRYQELRPGDLRPGGRVALFVHGFASDSSWMVSGPAQTLVGHGTGYNHLLTFDYESFNTRIADNGQALAEALRAAGFGPDDGLYLDVFAHSMGALVTRSCVEAWGGDEFVDRCFLAGPPNEGTRLASARRLIPWIGTLLLNQLSPAPPTLIASWALKKISDDAVGPDDLRPGSDFLRQLNASMAEVKVPYYILAGRNDIPAEVVGVWQRFRLKMEQGADAALDFIFGDENDLVVDVRSMVTVRGGTYPRHLLHTQAVPCDHFGYFRTPEAQAQLLRWVETSYGA